MVGIYFCLFRLYESHPKKLIEKFWLKPMNFGEKILG